MTYSEFTEKFNIKLSPQQKEAMQCTEGAVLLLAVPGSGKTTVLVSRLGYMLYCRSIAPESILTMTYTVAATKDMRQRFSEIFGDEYINRLEFRTINGVCAKIISSYEQLNSTKAFQLITSEKEINTILTDIYRQTENEYPTESDIKSIRSLITYCKNMMLDETSIKELDTDISFYEIFKSYNNILVQRGQMDYDDQMVYAYRILLKHPQLLARLQSRYKYVCVDEAQDTSKIQHQLIKLISSDNLFMVGDEDQSIYGFRAAYPEALLNFENDHSGSRVLLMEHNFRSDANIVEAAERFISKNKYRHKKTMRAEREKRHQIRTTDFTTRQNQYNYLLKVASDKNADNTAILYRDNESLLPLVDLFERNGIRYRTRTSDLGFFSHRIIYDVLDIIAFAYDPCDPELFKRIYYKLSLYLNKDTANTACAVSKQRGISILQAALDYLPLTKGTKSAVKTAISHLEGVKKDTPASAVYRISNYMGYGDYLERMGMNRNKLVILEALAKNLKSIKELGSRLSELRSTLEGHSNTDGICLSTIHSSKGLEYDRVFMIDVCDGIFPECIVDNYSYAEEDEIKSYEEERRLFYVGITRAKNELVLFRYSNMPSSFCDELITASDTAKREEQYARYKEYSVIEHRVFGRGTILSRDGDLITVSFGGGKTKKLSLSILIDKGLI